MTEDPIIYISSSEVACGIPAVLDHMEVPCKIGHLKVCDYVIRTSNKMEEALAFERKDVHDLIGSIIDGRFKTQLSEMSTKFNHSYLIIEGIPSAALASGNFNRKSYFNNIMSATLKRSLEGAQGRISTISSETPIDTAIMLEYAYRQVKEGRLDLIPAAPIHTGVSRQASALSIISGVGIKSAQLIMQEAKTLERAFIMAQNKELRKIKGIGSKTEDAVLEFYTRKIS